MATVHAGWFVFDMSDGKREREWKSEWDRENEREEEVDGAGGGGGGGREKGEKREVVLFSFV